MAKHQIVREYHKKMDGSILIRRQKLLIHPMLSAGWRAFTGLKTLLLDHHGEQNLPNPILLGIWIHQRWLVLWVTILIAIDVPIRQIARKKCEISSNTLLNKTWGTFNMIKNIPPFPLMKLLIQWYGIQFLCWWRRLHLWRTWNQSDRWTLVSLGNLYDHRLKVRVGTLAERSEGK